MKLNPSFSLRAVALAAGVLFGSAAQAALFEDTDARRAILELRERVERHDEQDLHGGNEATRNAGSGQQGERDEANDGSND